MAQVLDKLTIDGTTMQIVDNEQVSDNKTVNLPAGTNTSGASITFTKKGLYVIDFTNFFTASSTTGQRLVMSFISTLNGYVGIQSQRAANNYAVYQSGSMSMWVDTVPSTVTIMLHSGTACNSCTSTVTARRFFGWRG